MANPEHLEILKKGVEAWNAWRQERRNVSPDFRRANLISADLAGANLSDVMFGSALLNGSNLLGANLRGANLMRASLIEADLTEAVLANSTLLEANLCRADLTGADLSRSILAWSNLSGANLSESNVFSAYFSNTTIASIDLRSVKNLDSAVHDGPSSLDIETIYLSRGQIPTKFLRGAGIPENVIAFIWSLTTGAFEFCSAFISYSTKNQDTADRIHSDLQAKGVRCWLATEDLKIGDPFRQRIDESIKLHDKLLLILSEYSVQSSWVQDEVEAALERERRDKRLVLFPIRIDDAVMDTSSAWAASIRRTRHIGDFTQWKDHDAYQKAFERLLRDLKDESKPKG